MEERTIQSRLDAIEIRARRLDRWLKLAAYGWLLTISVLLLSAWTRQPRPQRESKEPLSVLRVRQLIIADEKGVERIVVGPVPDPQVMGKRMKRRVPGTEIQLNDASGNERGGIALLDDGSVVVGIDDEMGRERAHLYFIPTRGAGPLLQDGKEAEKISLLVPPAGQSANAKLEITDEAGKSIFLVPTQK